jgi:hypothetical protein
MSERAASAVSPLLTRAGSQTTVYSVGLSHKLGLQVSEASFILKKR